MEPASRRPTALFDTNVILDVLLERHPFFDEAAELWKKCDDGAMDGYVAAVTATTIFYVARKLIGVEKAREAIGVTLRAFQVAPVYRETLESALRMSGADFEDDVQIACAQTSLIDRIVTRDLTGFAKSPIPVATPREMLRMLSGPQPT